jgi:hypothetical protein
MELKPDENLSRHLKPVLIGLGHDVLTAADENLLSHPDTEIDQAAKEEQRMLMTLDVEFADLRKYPNPGISSKASVAIRINARFEENKLGAKNRGRLFSRRSLK